MQHTDVVHALSGAAQVALYNSAIENHSLPVEPIKRFATKGMAVAKISALCREHGLEVIVINDGEVALAQPEKPEGSQPTEPKPEAAAPSAGTFQHLPKDQLPAKGTPERAAYRKARRAAARARKAAKATVAA